MIRPHPLSTASWTPLAALFMEPAYGAALVVVGLGMAGVVWWQERSER
jgi:hypothetical protein